MGLRRDLNKHNKAEHPDEGKMERIAVYLDPELAMRLRLIRAIDRMSMSEAVTEALRMWLDSPKTKTKSIRKSFAKKVQKSLESKR